MSDEQLPPKEKPPKKKRVHRKNKIEALAKGGKA
jgi:hypothetical protein